MIAPHKDILKSRASVHESVMAVCRLWAELRSKDPNTKVGAAVYDPRTGGLFLGYNGFPPKVPDWREIWNERDRANPRNKYAWVVHAEANAIRKALMALHDLSDCDLFCTHKPCCRCLVDWILPSGIKRIHYEIDYLDVERDQLLACLPLTLLPAFFHMPRNDA